MVPVLQLTKVSAGRFLTWVQISVWTANLLALVGTKEGLLEKKLEVVSECVLLETSEERLHRGTFGDRHTATIRPCRKKARCR